MLRVNTNTISGWCYLGIVYWSLRCSWTRWSRLNSCKNCIFYAFPDQMNYLWSIFFFFLFWVCVQAWKALLVLLSWYEKFLLFCVFVGVLGACLWWVWAWLLHCLRNDVQAKSIGGFGFQCGNTPFISNWLFSFFFSFSVMFIEYAVKNLGFRTCCWNFYCYSLWASTISRKEWFG